jgi:hypothetical protein
VGGGVSLWLVHARAVDADETQSRLSRQALRGVARDVRIVRVGAVEHRIGARVQFGKAGDEKHRFALRDGRGQVVDVDPGVVANAVYGLAPLGISAR